MAFTVNIYYTGTGGNARKFAKEMATGGDWKAGRRFSSSSSKNDVQSWISGFNV